MSSGHGGFSVIPATAIPRTSKIARWDVLVSTKVQLRAPTSMNKVQSNQEQLLASTLGLHIDAHTCMCTCSHTYTYTQVPTHTNTHTYIRKNKNKSKRGWGCLGIHLQKLRMAWYRKRVCICGEAAKRISVIQPASHLWLRLLKMRKM